MGERLTEAQRRFLIRCANYTFADNSGTGLIAQDGHDMRMASRLASRGLVSLPWIWTPFAGARITPAGRSLLKENPNG